MKIKVTIGVCARNCQNDLGRITERIILQDYSHENMEVIFVDDGSTDNTLHEIEKFAQKMQISYRVFHHEWKGLGFSRNVILKQAQGDYIIWVDDGVLIPKDYVAKLTEIMEKNQKIGIARGFIGLYSGSNNVMTLESLGQLLFNNKFVGKTTTNLPGAGGSIYRVEAARFVGGFNETIWGVGEDNDLAYRLLIAGWQIYISKNEFFIEHYENLRRVWKKSFWYGYGAHFVVHRNGSLSKILIKSNPFVGFIEGLLVFSVAYRKTQKKIALFLPIYYFLKRTVWCFGFLKSHKDAYGHLQDSHI
jgi:glycosyltransferase involved in cell wall biosynthesis